MLLLWPELAEIGLPAGLTLKRRIDAQEQALDSERHRAELIERRLDFLQTQQQTAIAGSSAHASLIFAQPKELLDALGVKERVFVGETQPGRELPLSEEPRQKHPPEEEGADRADLERELIAITLRAVERHVSSIFGKLGLPSSGSESRRVLAVLLYLRS